MPQCGCHCYTQVNTWILVTQNIVGHISIGFPARSTRGRDPHTELIQLNLTDLGSIEQIINNRLCTSVAAIRGLSIIIFNKWSWMHIKFSEVLMSHAQLVSATGLIGTSVFFLLMKVITKMWDLLQLVGVVER